MTGYWIRLRNSAGVLDEEFAEHENQIKTMIEQIVARVASFHEGDVLTVEAGETA